jgi:hypothetical protein
MCSAGEAGVEQEFNPAQVRLVPCSATRRFPGLPSVAMEGWVDQRATGGKHLKPSDAIELVVIQYLRWWSRWERAFARLLIAFTGRLPLR